MRPGASRPVKDSGAPAPSASNLPSDTFLVPNEQSATRHVPVAPAGDLGPAQHEYQRRPYSQDARARDQDHNLTAREYLESVSDSRTAPRPLVDFIQGLLRMEDNGAGSLRWIQRAPRPESDWQGERSPSDLNEEHGVFDTPPPGPVLILTGESLEEWRPTGSDR